MMMLPVWICMPHAKIMVQILQPENDRQLVVDDAAENSRKAKSAEADVISQTLEPKFVACSMLGNDITEVQQTAKTSIVIKKHKLAIRRVSYLGWRNFGANLLLR